MYEEGVFLYADLIYTPPSLKNDQTERAQRETRVTLLLFSWFCKIHANVLWTVQDTFLSKENIILLLGLEYKISWEVRNTRCSKFL